MEQVRVSDTCVANLAGVDRVAVNLVILLAQLILNARCVLHQPRTTAKSNLQSSRAGLRRGYATWRAARAPEEISAAHLMNDADSADKDGVGRTASTRYLAALITCQDNPVVTVLKIFLQRKPRKQQHAIGCCDLKAPGYEVLHA